MRLRLVFQFYNLLHIIMIIMYSIVSFSEYFDVSNQVLNVYNT